MDAEKDITAVILAAGKGTRMKSEHPKVATLLAGKPLLIHVLDHLNQAQVNKSVVVVGYKKEEIIKICEGRPSIQFCEQTEQLGTGHAVLVCKETLRDFQGTVIVACGDAPMISANSFKALITLHNEGGYAATLMSADLENPAGYGRIVRSSDDGTVLRIVEEKDASPEEKSIREVNTGTYCFDSQYLWDGLASVGNQNAQNEYYLPDLVTIFRNKNLKIGAMKLKNSIESYGINSPADLEFLSKILSAGAAK